MLSENILQALDMRSFASHAMLQADGCDPSAEACIPEEALVRPDSGDLYGLTTNYLAETFILLLAPVITAFFFTDASAGLEILFLFFPAIATLYAYIIPLFLTLVYGLFGASFFLFAWVDNVLAFLIEHYISNVQLLFPVVVFLAWSWIGDS